MRSLVHHQLPEAPPPPDHPPPPEKPPPNPSPPKPPPHPPEPREPPGGKKIMGPPLVYRPDGVPRALRINDHITKIAIMTNKTVNISLDNSAGSSARTLGLGCQ